MSKEGAPSNTTVEKDISQKNVDFANETAKRVENEINSSPESSLAEKGMKVGDTLGTKADTENIDIKPKEDKKSSGFSQKLKDIWKSIDSVFDLKPISKMTNPEKIMQMAKDDAYELTTISSSNTGVGGVSLGGGINWGAYGERYDLSAEAQTAKAQWSELNQQRIAETNDDKRVELQRQQNAIRLGFGSKMINAAQKRVAELESKPL